jgi:hypothetical protein
MSHKKELQDLSIRAAISGCEDLKSPGAYIEEDYLRRERNENLREAGFTVRLAYNEEEIKGMTEFEREVWKAAAQLRELHDERYEAFIKEKEGHLEDEIDIDYVELIPDKVVIKL